VTDRRPRNLVELIRSSCEEFAERPALGTKHHEQQEQWAWMSYRELGEQIDACRAAFSRLGIGAGDVVAIISDNRVEWALAFYATVGLGAAFVPMYTVQRAAEWAFILRDAGAKLALAQGGPPLEHLREVREALPQLEHLVALDEPATAPDSLAALLEASAQEEPVAPADPAPETLAGLIYTSGTTGKPKGVMLSHANITTNVATVRDIFPLSPDDRLLSFLPWAHAYGQLELHFGLACGASLALNDDIARLLPNLAEVKPTMLVTVPRVFHRVYAAVQSEIARRPPLIRRMFDDGIRSSIRKRRGESIGALARIELGIDDKLLFRKIRKRFGGRLKYVISASASLGTEVAQFVDALGLDVYEGYGLTETSPLVSANTPEARRLGSVGKVIPGVRVEIDESAGDDDMPGQGEIIVYGHNVMMGYHDRPAENAEVFTADGGIRTGDLGYLDDDGFLYITGRLKEQYKLESGKYVVPGPLEEQLKLSPYIENVMLHGMNRPYNVALVVIAPEAVRAWAREEGIELEDPCRDPRVEELILAEIERLSTSSRTYEVPRRVRLIADDFTIEGGLLTPTLKLKRKHVEERYGDTLDALYDTRHRGEAHPPPA
jgi:long-chain acyl-CoA synthetase